MYISSQKGGRVSMPSQYFDPGNLETYVNEVPNTIGKSFPNPPSTQNQNGGRVSMPSQYFDPGNLETYVNEVPSTIGRSWPNPPSTGTQNVTQTGGVGAIKGLVGSALTNITDLINGAPITYQPLRFLPENNGNLQVSNSVSDTLNTTYTGNEGGSKPIEINVPGFPSSNIPSGIVKLTPTELGAPIISAPGPDMDSGGHNIHPTLLGGRSKLGRRQRRDL